MRGEFAARTVGLPLHMARHESQISFLCASVPPWLIRI